MAQSKPSITGTAHTLPFDRLSPRDFERLCLWLIQREGFERAEHLGAAGSEQGRDLVAWREGQQWAFQCKRMQRFGPGDAEAEVDKVLAVPEELRPAALVFLVACDVSDETRRRARARCGDEMACEFWALTELDERAKHHPDIVEEFFQASERTTIQRILGIGPDERRALRNRRAMLELVRNFWVEGVLEQSLHGAAMIELGMEEKPGAVEYPWDMVLQTGREDHTLSPGAKIIDVFDEVGRNLLILGEPGSGKTTMLLELARDTIARAEEDPMQPIPVVFNLSSWADERQPVAQWLMDELNTKYNIPKKVARPWIESDELLLLLDGLDEVALRCREDCVRAINEFRREHLVSLVVCSRVADYEALTARLSLQGAILLQPLTTQQVDDYLAGAGTALSVVRQTLQQDPTLHELAQTPLMLSIMTLVYRGVSAADLQTLDTAEARRQHLLDAYVHRMFERRVPDQPYSPRQTTRWLAWLAQKMSQHNQSIFLIERIQPRWLRTTAQLRLDLLAGSLICGLIGGLGGGLFFGLLFDWASAPTVGLVIGGFVGGAFLTLDCQLEGIVVPVEVVRWSWPEGLLRLIIGLVIGLIVGRLLRPVLGRTEGLIVGLIAGLSIGLFEAIVGGLRVAAVETRMIPNQGIRHSARNAMIVGLLVGLGVALIFVFAAGLISSLISDLSIGLHTRLGLGVLIGLTLGMTFGLVYGGQALVQHFVLRFILWRNGHMPWNLVRFLDYAAERIFLRKVGGGYIFIHRLLQDHFASLYQDQ